MKTKDGLLGSFQETAQFGETIVLAVSGLVAEDAINLAGKEHFSNKIIIDATNPIAAVPPENGVLKYFTTLEESLMEKIQKQLPDAKVVKHLVALEMHLCTNRILMAAFPPCSFVAMMTRQKKQL
jgi:predicted dinucleotide-binding enzyme